jgi:hypothetical protein
MQVQDMLFRAKKDRRGHCARIFAKIEAILRIFAKTRNISARFRNNGQG